MAREFFTERSLSDYSGEAILQWPQIKASWVVEIGVTVWRIRKEAVWYKQENGKLVPQCHKCLNSGEGCIQKERDSATVKH